jgi:hypothetical protein
VESARRDADAVPSEACGRLRPLPAAFRAQSRPIRPRQPPNPHKVDRLLVLLCHKPPNCGTRQIL